MTKNEILNKLRETGLDPNTTHMTIQSVIDLVEKIEEPVTKELKYDFDILVEGLVDEFDDSTDWIDDYSLSMSGREVELRDVTFDTKKLRDYFKMTVDGWLEVQKELQQEEEETN